MGAAFSCLQGPRQIPAPRTAWIIHVAGNLLWAFGSEFSEPINELGVTAAIARNWLVRSRPPSLTAFGSS